MQVVQAPLLESDVVRLVSIDASHEPLLRDAVAQTDANHWKYTLKNPILDFDDWYGFMLDAHAKNKQHVYIVFDKRTGSLAGSTTYLNILQEHDQLEIGTTWYVPSFQGTIINLASKVVLLIHAFEEMKCNRVQLKCDALNSRSRRAIAKLGAREEGILRHHMKVPDGDGNVRYRDTAYYSILAYEWPGVKEGIQRRLVNSFTVHEMKRVKVN